MWPQAIVIDLRCPLAILRRERLLLRRLLKSRSLLLHTHHLLPASHHQVALTIDPFACSLAAERERSLSATVRPSRDEPGPLPVLFTA